ncbi:HNH endonuclease [Ktedonosporobacter rubrisoli]|uniref:HNH endonuclease n=1 Tax=Ktedonosporobacter rubrisoli TaxID=2509675 RepID=UPI0013EE6A5C|nr:HNH endonuclease [Ktedonosporobacter rubrisoli]
MDNSILIPLAIVIAVLIVGYIFLRPKRKRHYSRRRLPLPTLRRDYGAHIAKKHGRERSAEWERVAREHRLREPACVACGYRGHKLQVHHIKPFHLHPELELDPNNLITLCEARGREHHLLLGHLGAWDSYNEHIRADIKHFYRKTAAQIRADVNWLKKMQLRP